MVSKMGTGAARMCLGWAGETSDEVCNHERTSTKADELSSGRQAGRRRKRKIGSTASMHEKSRAFFFDMMGHLATSRA
jgi:hypothetical protein